MTLSRCTWPETAYALSLMRPGHLPAQRAVLELFCAHALAAGVVAGSVICSGRDLSSHLHKDDRHGSAGLRALRGLERRGILRCLSRGTGTAPSEWDVTHWTRWGDVSWRLPEAEAKDRLAAFTAAQMRAQGFASARVLMVRALAKSARCVSADLEALARASMDARASEDLAPRKGAPMRALTGADRAPSLSPGSSFGTSFLPSEERTKEGAPLSDEARSLIAAFERGLGRGVFGDFPARLGAIADSANGSLGRVLELAERPDVKSPVAKLEALERALLEGGPVAEPAKPTCSMCQLPLDYPAPCLEAACPQELADA